ncbi:hypothetical protein A3860_36990 [Niastella vici]|uniref:Iron dicitrate transport regulator FecR n=1 Tax=Niastella vici TaxID=1703345 RepID=A0A1V9FMK9_9BACT|nr:FecR family protein [Niastella vici]OQP59589.1 hypothetical protein A3860_36990 [Niastella vici]
MKENAAELFARFLQNNCTEAETAWLMHEFANAENAAALQDLVRCQLENNSAGQPYTEEIEKIYEGIDWHIRQKARVRRLGRTIAIAAAVTLLIGAGTVYLFNKENKKVSTANNPPALRVKDFAPGSEKAVLTLANGSSIPLDTSGMPANANTPHFTQRDKGILVYSAAGKQEKTGYHLLTTPRGGRYRLILSDGTKVWLNAASSLRFPTNFTGSQRTVAASGEVYFEVAHNNTPFIVKNGSAEIKVLGTHFNINAYPEEREMKITLFQGKITVSNHATADSILLTPGEQAKVTTATGRITVLPNADTTSAMAWKNNLFYFNKAGIKTIMQQIGRWYDIDISYEGAVPARTFSGKISRNTNASTVLKILEQSNIHFRIEPKRIVVIP